MMKRFLLFTLFTIFLALPLSARTHMQGYVCRGGQPAIVGGVSSTLKYSQCYPGALMQVYLAGTSTLATIYSTSAGAAKSNGFNVSSISFYDFWVDDGTYTFTFSGGGIPAPFSWAYIQIGSSGISTSVTGFGARCDGVTIDTAAFTAAAAFSGPHQISIPAATCVIDDTVTTAQNGVSWIGSGRRTSVIKFAPTLSGGKIAFDFKASGGVEIVQNMLVDISFMSADTTYVKTAIRLSDTGQMIVDRIAVGPIGAWTDATKASIGLLINGREEGDIAHFDIDADRPIVIGKNPNVGIDFDHWHIHDYNTIADSNPNIEMLSGVYPSNFKFDGYQGWNRGTHGFYYNDLANLIVGDSGYFGWARWEQSQSTAGYMIYFSPSSGFRGLTVMGNTTGALLTGNGFLFRRTQQLILLGNSFTGTVKTALDFTTCDQVGLLGNFWNATSLFVTTGLSRALGMGAFVAGPAPGFAFEFWVQTANQSGPQIALTGTTHRSFTGTIAGGGTLAQIPDITTATARGRMFVSYRGTTTDGACEIGLTPVGTYTIGNGGTNCSAGNVGGKFCILFSGPAAVNILNNVAESVNYTIEMDWTP